MWVDSIGGYVRTSVETRREAVREMTEEGKSRVQIATFLGISEATVADDRKYLSAALQARELNSGQTESSPAAAARDTKVEKWSKEEIRALIDEGKTDAEIAVITGLAVDKIRLHYHRPHEEEQAQAELARIKAKKDAETSEADRKENDATHTLTGHRLACPTLCRICTRLKVGAGALPTLRLRLLDGLESRER